VTKFGCHVYLGSRNVAKGTAAVASIVQDFPQAEGKIEPITIDVVNNDTITAAAAALKSKGVTLYALVNNAGVGLKTGNGSVTQVIETNYLGPKRVAAAFVPLIQPKGGRIVNVSSGVASMWIRKQNEETQALFSNQDMTFEVLDAAVQKHVTASNFIMNGYGLSKAALTALTIAQANKFRDLKIVSLSPGFINTNLTAGYGAKLTPEQGCRSSIKCLFDEVTSGYYYGSDGLRSPLTCSRDPGTPEYQGEENPDPAKYKK
jgi:NAD(P)-dependent dehydrogenase (short-subunit alcohol dehydrogenase family)